MGDNMKKFFLDLIIGIWLIIAIFTTVTLLSFNDYRVAEFGSYSLFNVDNDELEPTFKEGDLVIQEKTSFNDINADDHIFFYNESSKLALINLDVVSSKEVVSEDQATFVTTSNKKVSSDYVIGKANDAKVIHNLGYVLSVLQSKWGFMFLVIFPTIFLFIYEIYGIFVEYQKQKHEMSKENVEDKPVGDKPSDEDVSSETETAKEEVDKKEETDDDNTDLDKTVVVDEKDNEDKSLDKKEDESFNEKEEEL